MTKVRDFSIFMQNEGAVASSEKMGQLDGRWFFTVDSSLPRALNEALVAKIFREVEEKQELSPASIKKLEISSQGGKPMATVTTDEGVEASFEVDPTLKKILLLMQKSLSKTPEFAKRALFIALGHLEGRETLKREGQLARHLDEAMALYVDYLPKIMSKNASRKEIKQDLLQFDQLAAKILKEAEGAGFQKTGTSPEQHALALANFLIKY